jgi:hypothetical protein
VVPVSTTVATSVHDSLVVLSSCCFRLIVRDRSVGMLLPLTSCTPVLVVVVSILLFIAAVDQSIVQSARRRLLDRLVVLMLLLYRRLTSVVRIVWRLTPVVVPVLTRLSVLGSLVLETHSCDAAGSTGLSVRLFNSFSSLVPCFIRFSCRLNLESRGLPHSHFVMLDHTSSFKIPSGNASSSGVPVALL